MESTSRMFAWATSVEMKAHHAALLVVEGWAVEAPKQSQRAQVCNQVPEHLSCPSRSRKPVLVRVRLLRKLAENMNGVDVSKVQVGDQLDLSPSAARVLILEGWAELVEVVRPQESQDLKNR